jgi:predicted CoA-binding protein
MHPPKKIIAVLGLSNRTDRPSFNVAHALQTYGYQIVGVNPVLAGQMILGVPCYASLTEAATALAAMGQTIDIVDCFRKSADMLPIAEEAIAIGAPCLWMQIGVINDAAARLARDAGLTVVMDLCTKVEVEAGRTHGVL